VERLNILAISGSLRRKSFNTGLVRAAQELAPEGMEVELFDLAPIPFYNADLEAEEGTPAVVQEFKRKIQAADGVLIATPEYNYSITGLLKNAVDWASLRMSPTEPCPLYGKPVAVMGAGGRFGTVRAQSHLRYILLNMDCKVLGKPEVMVQRAREVFDSESNLTDEATREQVAALMQAFQKWILLLRASVHVVTH
jgi:chromate reductase